MPGRTIAIADIHGCLAAFDRLLEVLRLQKEDQLVLLGDYVDRGPDSAGVIDRVLALKEECEVFTILGNHDELMLQVIDGETWKEGHWLAYGGKETLKSYGLESVEGIPSEHVRFLKDCLPYCESEHHFFTHASYLETKPLKKTPATVLRWESLNLRTPGPHKMNKVAVLGHTAQKKTHNILYLGHLICIDTYCYGDGLLTALDIHTGEYWQTSQNLEGVLRKRLK